MARRGRLYITLDVDFFDNPKIIAAGEPATALYLRGLVLCKRQWHTEGLIHENQLHTFRLRRVHERAAKLVDVGLWTRERLPNGGGYMVAGWLDRNHSATEVDRIAQERADAGSRGGEKSAQVRASQAKQSASENEASCLGGLKQTENVSEPITSHHRDKDISSSSDLPSLIGDQEATALLAFELIAKKRMESRTGPPITNPSGWLAKVSREVRAEHQERARQIIAERPDISAKDLAWYLSKPDQYGPTRRPTGEAALTTEEPTTTASDVVEAIRRVADRKHVPA